MDPILHFRFNPPYSVSAQTDPFRELSGCLKSSDMGGAVEDFVPHLLLR